MFDIWGFVLVAVAVVIPVGAYLEDVPPIVELGESVAG
jgi:hypothetical protein